MVTESTTDLVINVDGVNSISRAQVEQSLKETIEMIQKYCGGTVEITGIVE
jgi:DNA/RNA-binding domain of Phe-tRNA-synthetase-like protein